MKLNKAKEIILGIIGTMVIFYLGYIVIDSCFFTPIGENEKHFEEMDGTEDSYWCP